MRSPVKMKSFSFARPRAVRLTPRTILLTFILVSITTWTIFYLIPARGWRKPPGRSWHPAVYNPPPSLNPPWWTFGFGRLRKTWEGKPPAHFDLPTDTSKDPLCKQLPGADDVLVVIKTGATESRRKLPAHLVATLKCVPHYTVFGDIEETVAGQPVHDALDETTPGIKFTSADFELYRDQLEAQRRGRIDFTGFLDSTETRGHSEDVVLGKEASRVFALDKWKHLAMLQKSLERRGQARWFVFMEADTTIVWSNLLQLLGQLDDKKPWYLGGESLSEDGKQGFAPSGSSYVLSNPAIRAAVHHLRQKQQHYDSISISESRGDLVLAKLADEAQIPFTPAPQMFQSRDPTSVRYSHDSWCSPAISYHGLDHSQIRRLWDFEQRRIRESEVPTLHRDVYHALVSPFITMHPVAKQWDNLSGDKVLYAPDGANPKNKKGQASPTPTITRPITPKQSLQVRASQAWISPDACAEYCKADADCLQWSYQAGGTCSINYSIMLGHSEGDCSEDKDIAGEEHDFKVGGSGRQRRIAGTKIVSGWMLDRIEERKRWWEPCHVDWNMGTEMEGGQQAVLEAR
ncbi:MAG: hypothetical protein Q9162_003063 [Coniocarpon cinnabarinum]